MSASTGTITVVEADMAGTGQLCSVQNPCRSQCTCIKFCRYSNCLLRRGRIYGEFIILLYIEFYARKLNSARILRAAELSPSSSVLKRGAEALVKVHINYHYCCILPVTPFHCRTTELRVGDSPLTTASHPFTGIELNVKTTSGLILCC